MTLYAANGTTIKTYGFQNITVSFGLRRLFRWNFIIADTQNAIIGSDFLHYFDILVDIRRTRIIDNKTSIASSGSWISKNQTSIHSIAPNHQFKDLIQKFPFITKIHNNGLGTTHNTSHFIETKGPAVAANPRRLPPDKLKIAKAEFESWLEQGICRPSKSLLHMAKKKDGSWRLV